jgi:hypothetical protein
MNIDHIKPEVEKMSEVTGDSQTIGAFLDWLRNERGLAICEADEDTGYYYPYRATIEELLAEYFNIDLDRAEQEKRAILRRLRRKP